MFRRRSARVAASVRHPTDDDDDDDDVDTSALTRTAAVGDQPASGDAVPGTSSRMHVASSREVVVAAEYGREGRREHVWMATGPMDDHSRGGRVKKGTNDEDPSGGWRRAGRLVVPSHRSAIDDGGWLAKRLARRLHRWGRAAFLPEGYPHSVSDDYLMFQIWDTAQGLCSYVRGSLTTKALLEGVGVGEAGATAASATAQFVLRDMAGMLGGVAFATWRGGGLDADAKKWRLFADCANNVGMALELAAPFFGDECFLAFACAGAVARSLCGCAAGATRAAMTQHFAKRSNAADVAAKEGSQETAVTLVGMVLGMAVTRLTHASVAAQWGVFVVLTALHVLFNVNAVRALQLNTLNRERVRILMQRFRWHRAAVRLERSETAADDEVGVGVLTPAEVARLETLLPRELAWLTRPASTLARALLSWNSPLSRTNPAAKRTGKRLANRVGEIRLGARLSSLPEDRVVDVLAAAASLGRDFADDPGASSRPMYVLHVTPRGSAEERGWPLGGGGGGSTVAVFLRREATPVDELRAYVHAALVAGAAPPVPPQAAAETEHPPGSFLDDAALCEEDAERWMGVGNVSGSDRRNASDRRGGEFGLFLAGLRAKGWETETRVLLAADVWRFESGPHLSGRDKDD